MPGNRLEAVGEGVQPRPHLPFLINFLMRAESTGRLGKPPGSVYDSLNGATIFPGLYGSKANYFCSLMIVTFP
jgi:hypothetical protein